MEIKKIDIQHPDYPKKLITLKNKPKEIYVVGNIDLLNRPSIAIVGSRKSTNYGEEYAMKFSKELSETGITIVSGLALGIDTYAHIGAIGTKGNTIAVLGTSLENIYPRENKRLAKEIIENGGLLISEIKGEQQMSKSVISIENIQEVSSSVTTKENMQEVNLSIVPKVNIQEVDLSVFPKRNRIISGLSMGVIVIEAAYRSGSSITANLAMKQGKKVFCIPRSIGDVTGVGTNNLIKKGAKLVTNSSEILEELEQKNKIEHIYTINEIHGFVENEKNKYKINEIINKISNINPIRNNPIKNNPIRNKTIRNKSIRNNPIENKFIENELVFIKQRQISEEYKPIYEILEKEESNINSISNKLGINISELNVTLSLMEIEGLIKELPGNYYKII